MTHLQQVLDILVNGQGVDYAFSHDQLKQVQVKALVVGQYMPKPKGENTVEPPDVLSSLTNYFGDSTTVNNFWQFKVDEVANL